MKQALRSRLLNIYIFNVFLLMIIILIAEALIIDPDEIIMEAFIVWCILVVASEMAPITLPKGGASLSVGGAIDFGIILYFPTVLAGAAGSISGLSSSLSRKVGFKRTIFNISMSSITLMIPSMVLSHFGVRISSFHSVDVTGWPLLEMIIPYAIAVVAYFLLNTGLTSVAISLHAGGRVLDIWKTNYMWTIASSLGMAPIGLVLASVYHLLHDQSHVLAVVALLIFIIPLLFMRSSFNLYVKVNNAYFGSIKALISALDASHPYTQGHSQRVAKNSIKVAQRMKLSSRDVEAVEQGAILHDIGKIGMDNSILDKPGPLTTEEWKRMKMHPLLGAQIIRDLSFLKDAQQIVLHHHERIDGNGYPYGLEEYKIPIGAKIVNTLDALDALTSQRSYRRALSPGEALSLINNNVGMQFDPKVVSTVIELNKQGELIYQDDDETINDDIMLNMKDLEAAFSNTFPKGE